MRLSPLTLVLLCFALPLSAQSRLDGAWDGVMTVGGIYSDKALPMQLFLRTDGAKVTGRSYVQLPDGSTLQMELQGRFHRDQSMNLTEISFVGDPSNPVIPEFNRQYQIILRDDLWNPLLRGFWQEETEDTFGEKRRRGRMELKRRAVKGA